jgi:hypothetical protein
MREHCAQQAGPDGQHAGLTFELFDCAPDQDADKLIAVGTLPISIILSSAHPEVTDAEKVRCTTQQCSSPKAMTGDTELEICALSKVPFWVRAL